MSGKLWTVNCGMKDVNWEAFPLSFRASSWISPPLWRSEDGFQAKHHDQSEGSCVVPAAQLGPKSTARNCYQRSSLNIGPPGVTWVQSHPVSQRPVCLVFEKHLKLPIMCLWRGKDCFFKKHFSASGHICYCFLGLCKNNTMDCGATLLRGCVCYWDMDFFKHQTPFSKENQEIQKVYAWICVHFYTDIWWEFFFSDALY